MDIIFRVRRKSCGKWDGRQLSLPMPKKAFNNICQGASFKEELRKEIGAVLHQQPTKTVRIMGQVVKMTSHRGGPAPKKDGVITAQGVVEKDFGALAKLPELGRWRDSCNQTIESHPQDTPIWGNSTSFHRGRFAKDAYPRTAESNNRRADK